MTRKPLLVCILLMIILPVISQGQDSTRQNIIRRAINEGIDLISVGTRDTIFNENNAARFELYSGKIIRNIDIEHIGFDISIYDEQGKWSLARLADKLHYDTRRKVLLRHLFIKKGDRIDANKLGDNERYLRDRDFLLDCRIVPAETAHADSVDLIIITKDIFPLGGSVGGSFPTAPRFSVYDVNIDGRGQRIALDMLIDTDRSPNFGYGLSFRQSSILGSLADLELGYTQLDAGRSLGTEREYAVYARLTRPLVSPFLRMAGGMEVSRNWSRNVTEKEDSLFNSYEYNLIDLWAGYNMGIKSLSTLKRHFVALRYVDSFYSDAPTIRNNKNQELNDNLYGYIGEYTFYRQVYFKTRYVLRFGVTEDIPYGFSVGAGAGYTRILRTERPVATLKMKYFQPNRSGDFYQFRLQGQTYFRNGTAEDQILDGSFTYYTRAYQAGNKRLRATAGAGYTQLFNMNTNSPLRIGRDYLTGFSSDSLQADQRLTWGVQSTLYTEWSVLGFRMAPFAAIDGIWVNCIECPTDKSIYYALSAGIQTRNENLIFGTLELRFTYLPRDEYGDPSFSFRFTQRFRIREQQFITAPTLIRYN